MNLTPFRTYINERQQGTYVGVHYSQRTEALLQEYMTSIGYPINFRIHTTVAYSRTPLTNNYQALGYIAGGVAIPKKLDILSGALVLMIESSYLVKRHHQLRNEHDAAWDYDSYIPHITLAYDFEGDIDNISMDAFKTIDFSIMEEYSEVLNDN